MMLKFSMRPGWTRFVNMASYQAYAQDFNLRNLSVVLTLYQIQY
jgi:hypothetical protein